VSILWSTLTWACLLAGGVTLTVIVMAAGILAWPWARDAWENLRSRWRRHQVPGLPQDGWLSWEEQEWLKVIEAGYGDAPKALLRRLR
jgi:hypothetical protein